MHCMDCGDKLETVNYNESCTKWYCKGCNCHWYQTRVVKVEWSKGKGIEPLVTLDLNCNECGNKIDVSKSYGSNDPYYFCSECMNTDY